MKGGTITTRMMDIVRDGFTPLLQLMSYDLRGQFNTGLIKTKCLNTAVLITYLTTGKKGLRDAFTCSVSNIIPRYTKVFDRKVINKSNFHKFLIEASGVQSPRPAMMLKETQGLAERYRSHMIEELTSSENHGGRLHYILLTDSDMKLSGSDSPDTMMFPGHVFTIDQRPGNEYHLYQSYINAYDMKTEINMYANGSTRRGKLWMKQFFIGLKHFISTDVWDKKCADFWQFLTHTDATKFIGYDKSEIYLCHNSISTHDATKHFKSYISDKIDELDLILKLRPGLESEIHGDSRLYEAGMRSSNPAHRSKALTVGEMHSFLKESKSLIEDI